MSNAVAIRFGSSPFQFAVVGTNFCGPGYADGKFISSTETPTNNNRPISILDGFCAIHDDASYLAERSANPYQQQLAADEQLLNNIASALGSGQITTVEERIQATAVLAAFLLKTPLYTQPLTFLGSVKTLMSNLLIGVPQRVNLNSMFNSPEWETGSWTELVSQPSLNDPNWRPFQRLISARVPTAYTAAQAFRPTRDPLVLNLDGDGLETVGPSTTAPILFDHDGDGIKTGTGWVKADDGFLVLDRNGNGSIDNGSELFGDATPLYAGGKAADGFAALAQEDSNLDSKVDSADARWSQIKIWRDLNQDGLSQAGELFTPAVLNIAAIAVAKTENSRLLPDGNQIADLGSYTRTDGTTSRLADINLAIDTFHRQFPDTVPLTDSTRDLPTMQGSGLLRDLRQAASQSGELATLLAQYAAAPTRAAQLLG